MREFDDWCSIWDASDTSTGINSTPNGTATAWIAANWPILPGSLGSRITATRITRGTTSFSNSIRFELRVYSFKQGHGLEGVDTLGDPRLKDKHIGIVAGTPPGNNMVANGLMANAKPYPLVIDTRVDSSAAAMMHDLATGEINAGILWGPMAGYYARQATPAATVVPLVKETTGPRLAYRIAMGVRYTDQEWKRLLNRTIGENQPAINKLLLNFGVPLLDDDDRAITEDSIPK